MTIVWRFCWFMALSLLLALPAGLAAQESQGPRTPAAKSAAARARQTLAITPEREAAVFAFVERHHPELEALLGHLKQSEVKQYQRAVRELYTASERLGSLHDSDPERYELELRAWKLRSRIQLLSAKLSMGSNEQFKSELREALADQHDARRDILKLEERRTRERLARLEKNLADHEARREAAIERQLETLTAAPLSAKSRTTPVKTRTIEPKPGESKP
jgi:hypothetical protein